MRGEVHISIITPVYNGIGFIEYCINNVISQDCPHMEHVIVDGGSTDGTVEVIRKYAGEFQHILWVSEKDKGQSDAMNKGIDMANGNIIGFLNVDDYYEPKILPEILDIFKKLPAPSLLVGNCYMWDDNDHLHFVSKPFRIGLLNLLMEKYEVALPFNASAYFYHKSLHETIGPYKVDEHYGMDVHFIFQAVQNAHVKYVDKMWGNYRYLIGTKTYIDNESGQNPVRVKAINEYYKARASLRYRFILALIERIKFIYYSCCGFIRSIPSR